MVAVAVAVTAPAPTKESESGAPGSVFVGHPHAHQWGRVKIRAQIGLSVPARHTKGTGTETKIKPVKGAGIRKKNAYNSHGRCRY